jgi:SAM-dependent methyltransferase
MENDYSTLKYNSKSRWLSYWHQISETLEVSPNNVLVIGKGSGVTENSLKLLTNKKTRVFSLDIKGSLLPDVIGDISSLPFKNDAFDVSLCCQVLEHMPFEHFPAALNELRRISRNRVVISVPHGRKHLKISWHFPFLGGKTLIAKYPFTKKRCTSKQHYWEIGRGASLKLVKDNITGLFEIEKEFLNEISCGQRFFVLKKR